MQLPTPYPTAIYIRERALVVNLQSVRVIITAEFAYVISVPNPQHHDHAMIPTVDSCFVKELMQRVSSRTSTLKGCVRVFSAPLWAALGAMNNPPALQGVCPLTCRQ